MGKARYGVPADIVGVVPHPDDGERPPGQAVAAVMNLMLRSPRSGRLEA
jgi:hypothetical protein